MSAQEFTNVQVKAEVLFRPGASGSLIVRANRTKKPPPPFVGYAVRIGNAAKGFRHTGTLLGYKEVIEQYVKEDEWFTLHTIVVGDRVVVRLNGQTVMDHTDTTSRFKTGGTGVVHGSDSAVRFRNIRAQALPADEAEAWKLVRKAAPGLK